MRTRRAASFAVEAPAELASRAAQVFVAQNAAFVLAGKTAVLVGSEAGETGQAFSFGAVLAAMVAGHAAFVEKAESGVTGRTGDVFLRAQPADSAVGVCNFAGVAGSFDQDKFRRALKTLLLRKLDQTSIFLDRKAEILRRRPGEAGQTSLAGMRRLTRGAVRQARLASTR